ncbi:MAG TPA: hypothetical protein VGM41_07405 [Chitinophagaceae bacterium]
MNKKLGKALPVSGKLADYYFEYEMGRHTKGHKEYTIAGWGNMAKKILFRQWADTHFKTTSLLVYMFFNRRRQCLYVGKTGCGSSRPLSQFDKHWINKAKFIRMYKVSNRKYLSHLERLATHHYMPRQLQRMP